MPPTTLDIPLPMFAGTDSESVHKWIYMIEVYFYLHRVPAEDYFSSVLFCMTGLAQGFACELVVLLNNGQQLNWRGFKMVMRKAFGRNIA